MAHGPTPGMPGSAAATAAAAAAGRWDGQRSAHTLAAAPGSPPAQGPRSAVSTLKRQAQLECAAVHTQALQRPSAGPRQDSDGRSRTIDVSSWPQIRFTAAAAGCAAGAVCGGPAPTPAAFAPGAAGPAVPALPASRHAYACHVHAPLAPYSLVPYVVREARPLAHPRIGSLRHCTY